MIPAQALLAAIIALHVIAIADVWFSRLSSGAKILWSLMVAFLVGPGLLAWLITRHTAYHPVEELPA